MKILKLCRIQQSSWIHYYVIFDEIPQMTYEKVGTDYVGSACMEDGTVIFSEFLKKRPTRRICRQDYPAYHERW